MSGCGRKHRAKHLVTQYLDDAWEGPEKEGDLLAVCISSPAAKHVHVVIVESPSAPQSVATKKEENENNKEVEEGSRAVAVPAASESDKEKETPEPASEKEPERFVANLPGKFNKVLWLGCGDLIVLRLGTVHYKPSPQQLKYFYGTPAGTAWEPSIQRAEKAAIGLFKKVQSQTFTTVANQNLSGGGKFTVRANPQGGASEPVSAAASSATAEAVLTEQVTKTSKYFAAANSASRNVVEEDILAGAMGGGDGSEDDLDEFVNPNRQSIKHRRQAFFPDDEPEEDEEEEGEEEDDEEDE